MNSRVFARFLLNIIALDILITTLSVKSIVGLNLLELSAEEKTLFEPPFEDIVKGKLYEKLKSAKLIYYYHFIAYSFIMINGLKVIISP